MICEDSEIVLMPSAKHIYVITCNVMCGGIYECVHDVTAVCCTHPTAGYILSHDQRSWFYKSELYQLHWRDCGHPLGFQTLELTPIL